MCSKRKVLATLCNWLVGLLALQPFVCHAQSEDFSYDVYTERSAGKYYREGAFIFLPDKALVKGFATGGCLQQGFEIPKNGPALEYVDDLLINTFYQVSYRTSSSQHIVKVLSRQPTYTTSFVDTARELALDIGPTHCAVASFVFGRKDSADTSPIKVSRLPTSTMKCERLSFVSFNEPKPSDPGETCRNSVKKLRLKGNVP
jgi:hypothetical protein